MKASRWIRAELSDEFRGAQLGDVRREQRLLHIAKQVGASPGQSFPAIFEDSAELEAFYRFVRNDAFGRDEILEPHIAATMARATEAKDCLVLHDTTEFSFSSKRADLGQTSSSAGGFLAHVSLLVADDRQRTPLGVGALRSFMRTEKKGRRSGFQRQKEPDGEGRRWLAGVEDIERRLDKATRCIHVADREGDSFGFFAGMTQTGARFVVRGCHNRRVADDESQLLKERLLSLAPRVLCDIEVSMRGRELNPKMRKRHPERRARLARIAIAGTRLRLNCPPEWRTPTAFRDGLELNVVHAWEPEPPTGEPPVEWILWTTEAVSSPEELKRVVEVYRTRWTIEEYFKAIKTGCQFTSRQLDSFATLTAALALFVPVAWKLLLARSVARGNENTTARTLLSPFQKTFLEHRFAAKLVTARDALLAVARYGGHLARNGDPGWLTIGRGYEKLIAAEQIFIDTSRYSQRCDQS